MKVSQGKREGGEAAAARQQAGGDNRIADDIPITQPLRTASAAAESENYAEGGEENYHNLPLQDDTQLGWSCTGWRGARQAALALVSMVPPLMAPIGVTHLPGLCPVATGRHPPEDLRGWPPVAGSLPAAPVGFCLYCHQPLHVS